MNLIPKTLRGQFVLMITFMGIITITSASFIIQTYWIQIRDNDKQVSQTLLRSDILALQEEHRLLVDELASRITSKKYLKTAILNNNQLEILKAINEEFFQYYVTAEILNVSKIYVFDKSLNLITKSSEGEDYDISDLCGDLVEAAKNRTGIERLKNISSLCPQNKLALFSTISPIGTLSPVGYIQIVTNPIRTFKKLEVGLKMPIEIKSSDGVLLFQSPNWKPEDSNTIKLEQIMQSIRSQDVVQFLALKDISSLNNSIYESRKLIFIIVGGITLLSILIFYKLLDTSMIKPIRNLMDHLSLITSDNKRLQTALPELGSLEIRSLTNSFNSLTRHLSQLYESLENMAFVDQLTTLPNRSRLKEVLQFHQSEYESRNISYTLFMMDLDRFKSVNDTLGHHAGDKLLKLVSDRLCTVLRKTDYVSVISEKDIPSFQSDMIARLGGDEFAAILPTASDINDISKIAEKILKIMEEPFDIDGFHFSIGISIGIASCPRHGSDPDTLMRRADIAMYASKNNQTGFTFYDESIDTHSIKTLTLDDELKKAIQNNNLKLFYQPKIDLSTQKIIGVEALIRWPHPEHGMIFPDNFIPRAEQSGLINELTHWVIKTAVQQKAAWEKINIPISIAINLSAKNLLDSKLVTEIKSQLKAYNVKPEGFYFEITETAIMSDPSRSIIVLQELYDLGIRISIDDFGTGYSSLSYLKKLPADEIKIDRSFVMDMEHDPNDAIIVRSTIDLAHNMGLRVVAEGVENQNILEQLTSNDCDYAQGYHIARPQDVDTFLQWLKESKWKL